MCTENPVSALGDNHDFVVLESAFPPLCHICKQVIKKPCCCPTTICSAVFCFLCTRGKNSRCPTCNHGLKRVQISAQAEKQLHNFKAVCGFIGCNFAGTYEQVLAHIPRCTFGSFDSRPRSKVATCKRITFSNPFPTVNHKVWLRRDCIVIESSFIPSCGLCKQVVYGPCFCSNQNCFSVFCTYCLPQRSVFELTIHTLCPECKSELPHQGQVSSEANNELLNYQAKCMHCNYIDSFNNVSKHVEVCHECNEVVGVTSSFGSGSDHNDTFTNPFRGSVFGDNHLQNLSQEEQENRERRRKELIDAEVNASQKLKEFAESAQLRDVKFLNIQDRWSGDERCVFKKGLVQQVGRTRLMYCELTGFNAEWIKRATTQMLVQACKNLEIKIPKTRMKGRGSQTPMVIDYELAQEKLFDFLEGRNSTIQPPSTGFDIHRGREKEKTKNEQPSYDFNFGDNTFDSSTRTSGEFTLEGITNKTEEKNVFNHNSFSITFDQAPAYGGFTFGGFSSPSGKNTEQRSGQPLFDFSFKDTKPSVNETLFSDYLRNEYILEGLKDMGFMKPSKIQEEVLKVTADRLAI
jgi:hypothetical protein